MMSLLKSKNLPQTWMCFGELPLKKKQQITWQLHFLENLVMTYKMILWLMSEWNRLLRWVCYWKGYIFIVGLDNMDPQPLEKQSDWQENVYKSVVCMGTKWAYLILVEVSLLENFQIELSTLLNQLNMIH